MRLRDELWFKGREWFQNKACSMPQDEALIAGLTAPTYTFSSTGKLLVESKADMKKRGLRSPDLADAFLLPLREAIDARQNAIAGQSRAITQHGLLEPVSCKSMMHRTHPYAAPHEDGPQQS